MKKIKNLLLVGCLLTVLTNCNDAIEIRQVGRLDAENAFRSVADLEQGLLGVYNQWDLTPEISLSANFTDEIAIGFDSGGQGFALYDFVLNAASAAASDFWVRNFRVNQRATVLLEAAALITPNGTAETDLYNNILAQAHFIRAYANFEMLTYFSPDPTDDNTLCVPLVNFVPGLEYQPLRDTTGAIWDYVTSDLNTAASLSTEQSNPTFISIDAINALRARMALTRGDNSTAESLAMQLLGSYGLANQSQYLNMWLDTDNTEIIFKLERVLNDAYDGQVNTGSVATGGGWAGSVFAFVNATLAGSPYFEMDRSIYDLLDVNDIRRDACLNLTAAGSIINPNYATDPDPVNTDILVIDKYPGSSGRPLMNDLKVFRSSEMLLIAAEARAYQMDYTGVQDLLEQLRTARFGSLQSVPLPTSVQEAVAAVLDERKIELCFEGHRYKDLKRSGVAGNRGIDRDPIACGIQSGACSLPASDYRFTLPIPIVEINANPAIGAQQNPGY